VFPDAFLLYALIFSILLKSLIVPTVGIIKHIIRITPEKGSNPRTIKVSQSLINRLGHVKTINKVDDPKRILGKYYRSIYRLYHYQRKRIARKLGNERLN
jgi:hypothetical protein